MALPQVRASLQTLSPAAKGIIGIGALLVIVLIIAGVSWWNGRTIANLRKEAAELKQENVRLSDSYNQALGVAKANERAAREEKLLADARIAEMEKRIANIAVIDRKMDTIEEKYAQIKANRGECPDDDAACLKLLCEELVAAGAKLKCQ